MPSKHGDVDECSLGLSMERGLGGGRKLSKRPRSLQKANKVEVTVFFLKSDLPRLPFLSPQESYLFFTLPVFVTKTTTFTIRWKVCEQDGVIVQSAD